MQILRMVKHDPKLLLVLALHHLVHFVRICIELARQYANAVSRSPLVQQITAWMARIAKRPWFRKSRNVLYHCAAFIVGSTYEDEHVAFTARKLVKNDAYRDRLLVPEIEDLVALCDALRLTLPQRTAYFQCFLHVDFMRRSSVSRAELLRYCNLRATPLTSFLLQDAEEATHRQTAKNRWDIMQLMAACFSICTADIVELVQLAVTEAIHPQDAENGNEVPAKELDNREEILEPGKSKEGKDDKQLELSRLPSICEQIDQCLAFFVGVPGPFERSLQTLLVALYNESHTGDQQERGESITSSVCFQEIHGVSTIFDIVRLFPVLIFPCIWLRRVLRTRVLGVKTWQYLQQRRVQLQPHLPTSTIFISVADIVAASQVQLQLKHNREDIILTPTGVPQELDSAPSTVLLDHGESARSDYSARLKMSTPRKIIPCIASEQIKSDPEASSYVLDKTSNLRLTFDQCSTLEEAWRVTANHALASVYIQCLLEDTSATGEELETEFQRVTKQIFAGKLSTERSERIRQRLVKDYGYSFAHTLLAKSNVKELNEVSKAPLDERRAKKRYAKAWRDSSLIEDKVMYWKEFDDPLAKRPFYYNVRTGESRWEKPANFVGKTKAKRKRKPKKANSLE